MSTPINSIIFPGSPEKYMLRDCRATTSESGAATNNEFGFIKVGYQGNKKKVPVSIDEDGNAYVELTDTINSLPTSDVSYLQGNNRWLIFDFQNENRRGLKVKKGTKVKLTIKSEDPEVEDEIRWLNAEEDLHYDFSDAIENFDTLVGANGTDFYVYLVPDGEEGVKLVISMDNEYPSDVENDEITYSPNNSRKIGQFHTLCADCNENMTGMIPEKTGITVGEFVDVQNYDAKKEPEFYNFYHKEITAVNDGTPYAVATIEHMLSGFKACDILPESVWCLNWHPTSKNWDGMVWCNSANICVDIYLQSGTGDATRSEYGAVRTSEWGYQNFIFDMQCVGKRLFTSDEFMKISSGSNNRSHIAGNADQTYVGGHSDTAGRRMISFIGCEECCGYLDQCVSQHMPVNQDYVTYSGDGRNIFGAINDKFFTYVVGGSWNASDTAAIYSGERAMNQANVAYDANPDLVNHIGGRGICDISVV